jgi:DNA-binding transcriptional ArsR family regulator
MAEKMTKREMFGAVLGILEGELARGEDVTVLIDGILHEVDLLDRKGNTGPNPKREAEKRAAKHEILNAIAGGFHRASAIATYGGMSVQRASALLKQLVAEGGVTRREEGKVVEFHLN